MRIYPFLIFIFAYPIVRKIICFKPSWTIHDENETEAATRTFVWYDGRFTCNHTSFCLMAYYEESDLLSDDQLAFVRLQCTHTDTLEHSVQVFLQGPDAIFWDYHYEPTLRIYHSCGIPGQIYSHFTYLPTVSAGSGSQNLTQNFTIALNYESELVEKELPVYDYLEWTYRTEPYIGEWMSGRNITKVDHLFKKRRMGWAKTQQAERCHQLKDALCFVEVGKDTPEYCEWVPVNGGLFSMIFNSFDYNWN